MPYIKLEFYLKGYVGTGTKGVTQTMGYLSKGSILR